VPPTAVPTVTPETSPNCTNRTIGGFVWFDPNGNNIVDEDERAFVKGPAGLLSETHRVELEIELRRLDAEGNETGRLLTTTVDGHFTFDASNFGPGSYTLRVIDNDLRAWSYTRSEVNITMYDTLIIAADECTSYYREYGYMPLAPTADEDAPEPDWSTLTNSMWLPIVGGGN
jgi:hypothetical protein